MAIRPPLNEFFNIKLRTIKSNLPDFPVGQTRFHIVHPTYTVAKLKLMDQEKIGLPPHLSRIYADGKKLDDKSTLKACGITAEKYGWPIEAATDDAPRTSRSAGNSGKKAAAAAA